MRKIQKSAKELTLAVNIKLLLVTNLRELIAYLQATLYYLRKYNKHTQIEQVAFCQTIRRYQILCCYRVSRRGLLKEQRLRELVQMHKDTSWRLCRTFQTIGHSHSGENWEFRATRFFLGSGCRHLALVRVVHCQSIVTVWVRVGPMNTWSW